MSKTKNKTNGGKERFALSSLDDFDFVRRKNDDSENEETSEQHQNVTVPQKKMTRIIFKRGKDGRITEAVTITKQ